MTWVARANCGAFCTTSSAPITIGNKTLLVRIPIPFTHRWRQSSLSGVPHIGPTREGWIPLAVFVLIARRPWSFKAAISKNSYNVKHWRG